MIRVCIYCKRPVSSSYFLFRIGCTCPEHGRLTTEETVKVPDNKAIYDDVSYFDDWDEDEL